MNQLKLDNYYALIYTYKTIGLDKLYEHYIKDDELKQLKISDEIEVCVLQTCNRVEAYLYLHNSGDIESFLEKLDSFHKTKITKDATILQGKDVVKHLFEVASGIDSLAIGEYEILGQIKDTAEKCKRLKIARDALDLLFTSAVKTGRRVRSETDISKGKTGVYSLAIDYAIKKFGQLKGLRVAIVGAGEIGSKIAHMLKDSGATDVTIFNRTLSKALDVASRYGYKAKGLNFDDIRDYDLVFLAIYYPEKIRLEGPKLIIDLSIPNIAEGRNVVTLETLKAISNQIMEKKMTEIEKARKIIENEIEKFRKEIDTYNLNRMISLFMSRIEEIRKEEVQEAINVLVKQGSISEDTVSEIIDKMSSSLLKKVFSPVLEDIRKTPNRMEYLNYLIEVLGNGNVSDSKAEKTKKQ
ncbi:glutamyl-tRNA reductase [Stygiolobus caldivivus]|uniref:Glutamyl-tRNA reductase n=1 Tax=Stygiolobus caldivivus TaxID=2824673 RepID=A0A8D5ZJH4_9CREN|nr:glutamyl-tRNA reductase [Stygiolobus caldivivus]BCU70380.1 glutamyl-tRNA reductase [Stygiolobus caldivivus]